MGLKQERRGVHGNGKAAVKLQNLNQDLQIFLAQSRGVWPTMKL